jgi:rod shape-determining protein MreD
MLAALILETTVFNYLAVAGVKPDLMLIVVIYLGLNKGALTGEISGFVAGFLQDIFSGGLIGTNALIKMIIGNAVSLGHNKLAFENIITQAVLTVVVTLVGVVLTIFLNMIFAGPGFYYSRVIINGLIASLYNAVLAIFIFRFLDNLHIRRIH